jgi:hypothetical protein
MKGERWFGTSSCIFKSATCSKGTYLESRSRLGKKMRSIRHICAFLSSFVKCRSPELEATRVLRSSENGDEADVYAVSISELSYSILIRLPVRRRPRVVGPGKLESI